MPAKYIVSFGETMLRLSPPPGTRLEEAAQLNVYVAGTESNTLACLVRLGHRATWLSALPDNPQGRHVERVLRGHGIDTSRIVWTGSEARLGIFYAEENPAPLGTHVYYDRAGSACAMLEPEALDPAGLEGADLLHLTGITPALGERSRLLLRRLIEGAQGNNIPISFDVNYRAKLWSPGDAAVGVEETCREASVLLCTRTDATALWGLRGEPQEVLRGLAGKFGEAGKTIVLTLGAEGAAELKDGVFSAHPGFATEGTHRFGSGDAFAAGYLYAHLEGDGFLRLKEAAGATPLMYGNCVAALKRCIAGDIAVVSASDVEGVILGGAQPFR